MKMKVSDEEALTRSVTIHQSQVTIHTPFNTQPFNCQPTVTSKE
jgi:hypothetical protein